MRRGNGAIRGLETLILCLLRHNIHPQINDRSTNTLYYSLINNLNKMKKFNQLRNNSPALLPVFMQCFIALISF